MENNSLGIDHQINSQKSEREKENETYTQKEVHKPAQKTFIETENEQEKYINKIKNNNDDIEIIISTINDNKRDYSYNSRYNNYNKRYDYYENNSVQNEPTKGNYNGNHYNNNYYGNTGNQNTYGNGYQNSSNNNYQE